MSPIRVLIADDHPVVRGGLRMAIAEDPMLTVISEAANGREAIEQIAGLNPDIAILDIAMPVVDGISALLEIRKHNSAVGAVLLTAHQGEDLFHAAMRAGANGYLIKDNALLEITNCIRVISSGGCYVTRAMALHLTKLAPNATPEWVQTAPVNLLSRLAPIERRIVQLVASQRSTRDIASQLGLSVRTIENRRSLICEKLGVGGANALLKFALDHKDQIG